MSNNFWMGSAEVMAGIALFYVVVLLISAVFAVIMAIYLALEERRQFRKERP